MKTTDNSRADALTDEQIVHAFDISGFQFLRDRANVNRLIAAVRSILAMPPVEQHEAAPAVPSGYAIVPIKPTEAMVRAGWHAHDEKGWAASEAIYRAMVAAAESVQPQSAPLEGTGNGADERAKPVAWFIDWPDEPDLGHYLGEEPCDGARNRALGFIDRAPREGAVPERIYQYAQPGSIEFDGAEAYEQHLNEHVKESVTMPPVKGVSIDGGYVIVTPAGGRDNAPAIKAAILALAGTEQTAIPTGWKAMPATLTQAMRMAMAKAASEYWKCTGRNSPDVIYEAAISSAPQPSSACASCGEHKNTPLRIDWMGGYVCLTCIDRELESRAPRTEVAGGVPRSVIFSLECTANWLEGGCDPKSAAHEIRLNLEKLRAPSADAAGAPADEPTIPAELHPDTAKLVRRFARALANKLLSAQRKYGYSDNWMRDGWADECRAKLMRHIQKGDPRDVAAYCAFLWHHNESTAPADAQAVEAVAKITGADEYGPMIQWSKHWTDLIGASLYAAPASAPVGLTTRQRMDLLLVADDMEVSGDAKLANVLRALLEGARQS